MAILRTIACRLSGPVALLAVGLFAAVLLAACDVAGTPAVAPGDAPDNVTGSQARTADSARIEPYVVKGRVTDSAGDPMSGVEVYADHTLLHDSHVYGISDDRGDYRIELRGIEPSSWRVGATVQRPFAGRQHTVSLHVDNRSAFAGRDGAIRNLQWRLSGSDGRDGWLGTSTWLYQEGSGYVDPEHLVVHFEPLELIDGSRGEPFTRGVDGSMVQDIPVGRHRVHVSWEPPGRAPVALPVRARGDGPYASHAEVGGKVDAYGHVDMQMQVEVPEGLD